MKITTRPAQARLALAAGLLIAASASPLAAKPAPAAGDYVSRAEYEELRSQFLLLKKKLDTLDTSGGGKASTVTRAASPRPTAADSSVASDVAALKEKVDSIMPGSTSFHVTGSMAGSFTALSNSNSNFSAKFSPIFLWHINDNLMAEAEIELELEGSETTTKLEYAQLDWNINDNMTATIGKFLNPMNIFVERYEAKWINKFPDTPLAIYDGILPESTVGAQIVGSVPLGPVKALYAIYVGNGPVLSTDAPTEAGKLAFDNFSDTKDAKAVGGRLGILLPFGMEVGYGIQSSKVGATGTIYSGAKSLLQSVDFDWTGSPDFLKGTIDLRGQYGWSKVDNVTYDPTGELGFGPATFDNKRSGGYIQASYRPSRAPAEFLRKFELLGRYDRLNQPSNAPGSYDEKRVTIGLDYWLTSYTVLKTAYEWDSRKGDPDQTGIILEAATGF